MTPRPDTRTLMVGSVLAAVLLLAGCSSADDQGTGSAETAEFIALLGQPQEAWDRLPHQRFAEAVERDSARSLGSNDVADYWVGATKDSDVCLMISLRDDTDNSAAVCTDGDGFLENGVSVSVSAGSGEDAVSADAYLLPADVEVKPLREHLANYVQPVDEPEGMTQDRAELVGEMNLIPVRPGTQTTTTLELRRADGGTFTFVPLR